MWYSKCEGLQTQRQPFRKRTHLWLEGPNALQGWLSLVACAQALGEGSTVKHGPRFQLNEGPSIGRIKLPGTASTSDLKLAYASFKSAQSMYAVTDGVSHFHNSFHDRAL